MDVQGREPLDDLQHLHGLGHAGVEEANVTIDTASTERLLQPQPRARAQPVPSPAPAQRPGFAAVGLPVSQTPPWGTGTGNTDG